MEEQSIETGKQLNEVVKKKRTEEKNKLWDEAAAAVDKMPVDLITKFAQSMDALVKDANQEPEEDRLAREIIQTLDGIKEDWLRFKPVDWSRESLDWLGRNMQCAWRLMNRLDQVKEDEREKAAKKDARGAWDNGCQFSEIKVDGFTFAMDGGNIAIVQKARVLPESDIPF